MNRDLEECGLVVVTGSKGLVGRNVIPFLRKSGWNLRLTDLTAGEIDGLKVEAVDLTSASAVRRLLQGAVAVVHLAIASAKDSNPNFPESPVYCQEMFEVNVGGTYILYEAMRELGVKRMVYMSSLTVALGGDRPEICEVEFPARPTNIYACTKLFGESLAWLYHQKCGMRCYCLRLGQPYPSGHSDEATWVRDGESSLTQYLTFFPDVARAIEAALCDDEIFYSVFNVVSANSACSVDLKSANRLGFVPSERLNNYV